MVSQRSRFSAVSLLFCALLFANVAFSYYPPAMRGTLIERQDANLTISLDGNCGGETGQTCQGSEFGNCCSAKGYCGGTSDYCGTECQSAFGSCPSSTEAESTATGATTAATATGAISITGSCGGPTADTCLGSEFGDCCSARGYCGSNSSYCGTGCQGGFGKCGDSQISSDGTCGGPSKIICQGSDYGNCCSQRGFCGASPVYCGAGCQSEFGTCFPPVSSRPADVSSMLSTATDADAAAATAPGASGNAPVTGDSQPSGLSGGAIGGVVVGSLAGLAVIGALVVFFLRRRRSQPHSEKGSELPTHGPTPEMPPNYPATMYAQGGYPQNQYAPKYDNGGQAWAAKELPVDTSYEMSASSYDNNTKSPLLSPPATQQISELPSNKADARY